MIAKHIRSPLILLCALTIVSACANTVKEVSHTKTLRTVPDNARPTPLFFKDAKIILPPGATIGYKRQGTAFCIPPHIPLSRTALNGINETKYLKETFKHTLESQGYDITGGLHLTDEDLIDDTMRAEYSITAKITDVQADLCEKTKPHALSLGTAPIGVKGKLYIAVDWRSMTPCAAKLSIKQPPKASPSTTTPPPKAKNSSSTKLSKWPPITSPQPRAFMTSS